MMTRGEWEAYRVGLVYGLQRIVDKHYRVNRKAHTRGLSKAERHALRVGVRHTWEITRHDLSELPRHVDHIMRAEMRKRGFVLHSLHDVYRRMRDVKLVSAEARSRLMP